MLLYSKNEDENCFENKEINFFQQFSFHDQIQYKAHIAILAMSSSLSCLLSVKYSIFSPTQLCWKRN